MEEGSEEMEILHAVGELGVAEAAAVAREDREAEREAYHAVRLLLFRNVALATESWTFLSQVCENLRLLQRKYDALTKAHHELLWNPTVIEAAGLTQSIPAVDSSLVESAQGVSEIYFIKVIGKGTFSCVYLGKWPSGQRCAVKRISKRDAKSIVDLQNLATEHEALVTLSRGPCVLALHCAFASPSYVYFVLEMFGQELYKYMQSHRDGLPHVFASAVIHGVANGLAFMHALGFAHRDIKPENVLIDVAGDRFDDIVVKLCDLGLCVKLEKVDDSLVAPLGSTDNEPSNSPAPQRPVAATLSTPRASPDEGADDTKNCRYKPLFKCCGSMGFFAPDMLNPAGYSGAAVDVWSLGCLGLEVVMGTAYFESFWFERYTIFFKQRGNESNYEKFVAWMTPTIKELRQLVVSYREAPDDTSDASTQTKIRKNWRVLSTASSCLLLNPVDRPTAFEVRETISQYVAPDRPLLSSVIGDCQTLTRQASESPPAEAAEPHSPTGGIINVIKRSLCRSFSRASDLDQPQSPKKRSSRSLQSVLFRGGSWSHKRVTPANDIATIETPAAAAQATSPELKIDLVARAKSDYSGTSRRGKVLVVDDSSVALHWICKAIERKFNCEVHMASSAIEALSLSEHTEYDAVLTDMIM